MNRRDFLVAGAAALASGCSTVRQCAAKETAACAGSRVTGGRMLFGACRPLSDMALMKSVGFDMMMGRESAESIVMAGCHLRHCHVAEWKTCRFPGHDPAQTCRLKPYFDALKRIGYTGGVSCECSWGGNGDFAKKLEKALNTLNGLIG